MEEQADDSDQLEFELEIDCDSNEGQDPNIQPSDVKCIKLLDADSSPSQHVDIKEILIPEVNKLDDLEIENVDNDNVSPAALKLEPTDVNHHEHAVGDSDGCPEESLVDSTKMSIRLNDVLNEVKFEHENERSSNDSIDCAEIDTVSNVPSNETTSVFVKGTGDFVSSPVHNESVRENSVEEPVKNEDIKDIDNVEEPVKAEDVEDINEAEESVDDTVFSNDTDTSTFAGFDSVLIDSSVERAAEMIQFLSVKEEELIRKQILIDSKRGNLADGIPGSVSEEQEMLVSQNDPNISTSDQPQSYNSLSVTTPLVSSSTKPSALRYGSHINIFEEQVPSGSKRVKKKRKFFGDFEDPDAPKGLKKQNVSCPVDAESAPNILNASGENKENFMNEDKLNADVLAEGDAVNTTQPEPVNQSKSKRSAFDISNPLFKEPFKYGWKREVCYRNLPEGSKGKNAYVTYFGPQGKKFKSIRHIVEHLPADSKLSTQHFTYSQERIFSESSEFELIRYLRNKTDLNDSENLQDSADVAAVSQSTPVASEHPKPSSKKKPTPNPGRLVTPTPSRLIIKKPKYLKQNDSEDDGLDSSLLLSSMPSSSTPKIVIKGPTLSSTKASASKSKPISVKNDKKSTSTSKKGDKIPKKTIHPTENAEGSSWTNNNSLDNSSPGPVKIYADTSTCSISCPLALGSVPTLQCTVCLGLYHFECCGIDASLPVHSYACKNCRSKPEVSSKLLLAVSEKCNANIDNNAVSSRRPVSKNTKIVDGVTTWLPSYSNVQLSSRHATTTSIPPSVNAETHTPLLQTVLELEGKRYIIVPKESIVSVSPNTNPDTMNTIPAAAFDGSPISAVLGSSCDYASEVNSGGVVLVPVMPSTSNMTSAVRLPYRQHNEFEGYERHGPGKRKLSEDFEASYPNAKLMRLDGEPSLGYRYCSALTLSNVTQIHDALTSCLKYLTVRDLLRVSMSCKYLNRVASEPSLWTTVRLKNSKVHDWEGFAKTLRKQSTKKLDMRKMLCPSSAGDVCTMWSNFLQVIPTVASLQHIEFGRCSSDVVETVVNTCPNLVVVNAVQLRNPDDSNRFSMESFAELKHLRELRLKCSNGLNMEACDNNLRFLCKDVIQVLSLTSIKSLNSATVEAIGDLRNLRILELGECSNELINQSQLADSLGRLDNLEKLRLESVKNLDPDFELLVALKDLQHLKCLELINIEVKIGFEKIVAQFRSIENLLIIPLYKTESASSNRVMLDSLLALSNKLKTCAWGLTLDMIKATTLYATQLFIKNSADEEKSTVEKSASDIIPVLKHISKPSEVELLTLKNLDKRLMATLPNTRVKVVTVPFSYTWRQSLSEIFK